jgi:hypothetical protein
MSYSAAATIGDVLSGQRILSSVQESFGLHNDPVAGPGAGLNVNSTVCTGCTAGGRPHFRPGLLQNWTPPAYTTITAIDFALPGASTWITETFNPASLLLIPQDVDLGMHGIPLEIRAKKISTITSRLPTPPSTLSSCKELLAARKGLLSYDQFESLGKQLTSLLLDLDDGLQISIVSLDALISFLSKHRPPQPNIALTKHGRFTASWTSGRRAKITLTFDQEGGTWVAVNLDDGTRAIGAFVINSLDGISRPYRGWVRP